MPRLQSRPIGHSREGRPIFLQTLEPLTPRHVLFIGGIHGDEPATSVLLDRFLDSIITRPEAEEGRLALIPIANPDGLARSSRYNANGVDLNRNFPTGWRADSEEPPGPAPFSEPESQALRDWVLASRPAAIVSLHWALAELDADGPQSTPLARAMWASLDETLAAPYRLRIWEESTEAGLCPGSFGQWAGFGLRYDDGSAPAMITLELPYDPILPRPDPLPEDHLDTVHQAWRQARGAYLEAAAPAVFRLLKTAWQWEG